jgi:hypothetical protein
MGRWIKGVWVVITRAVYLAAVTSFAVVSTACNAQQLTVAPPPASSIVSPFEALTIARSEGLLPLSRPVLRGRTYALNAVDSYGREVRVLLDAQVGEVVAVRPLAGAPPSYRAVSPPAEGPMFSARRLPSEPLPPDFDNNAPRPPRTVPAARSPGSVQAAAAVPRTPLPRSRPAGAQPAAANPVVPATTAGKPAANPPAESTDTPVQGFE